MAERKRIDEGAEEYIGVARSLLAQLKTAMSFNKLMVLSRTVDLPGGVQVVVSSVFGQDTITIHAPPALEARIAAAAEEERRRIDALPVQEERPVRVDVKLRYDDIAYLTDFCQARVTTSSTTTTSMKVCLAGRLNGRGVVWIGDDKGVGTLTTLGQRNSNERNARVYAFSSDGTIAIGSVEAYIPAVSGWQQRAAVWRSGFANVPDVILHSNPSLNKWSYAFQLSGSTYYVEMEEYGGDGRMSVNWNGVNGSSGTTTADRPVTSMGVVSSNGRVVVSGGSFRVDQGNPITWSGSGTTGDVAHSIVTSSSGPGTDFTYRLK